MAMVLLVLLAYIVHCLSSRRRTGVAAMLLAGIAVVLVGLSRLYLGVHYPSDVIAGFGVGFAWAVFCALAVEALLHPRQADVPPWIHRESRVPDRRVSRGGRGGRGGTRSAAHLDRGVGGGI